MTDYDAVVFDNDGVLVGLTDRSVLRRAARRACEAVGLDDPPDALVTAAIDEDLAAVDAATERHGVSADAFWTAREEHAIRLQREAIRDGGKPLFDDVAAVCGLSHQTAVVSNNQHETVQFVVDHYDLADVFDHVVGRDPTLAGTRRKKPDPHYLERALDELAARDVLYVGDSPKDVVAADRAGADAAFLRRPHRETIAVESEPAYRVADLWELAEILAD